MEITEVRVRLSTDNTDRLKAYCSVTFDEVFVVRDIKIVDGINGPFVAMPSRKTTKPCGKCRHRNQARARYCEHCGVRLPEEAPSLDDSNGRSRLHRDIAHPIAPEFRELLQQRVMEAYLAECQSPTDRGTKTEDEHTGDIGTQAEDEHATDLGAQTEDGHASNRANERAGDHGHPVKDKRDRESHDKGNDERFVEVHDEVVEGSTVESLDEDVEMRELDFEPNEYATLIAGLQKGGGRGESAPPPPAKPRPSDSGASTERPTGREDKPRPGQRRGNGPRDQAGTGRPAQGGGRGEREPAGVGGSVRSEGQRAQRSGSPGPNRSQSGPGRDRGAPRAQPPPMRQSESSERPAIAESPVPQPPPISALPVSASPISTPPVSASPVSAPPVIAPSVKEVEKTKPAPQNPYQDDTPFGSGIL